MKAFIKTIVLGFFATLCLHSLYSQNTVSYGYDAAGNRVSRTIAFYRSDSVSAPVDEEQPVVYSEMLSDIEVKIYPNPTKGLLKVEIGHLQDQQTAQIRLYSLSGSLIISRQTIDGTTEMDISGQATGIYVMKITAGKYQTEWKIIKK